MRPALRQILFGGFTPRSVAGLQLWLAGSSLALADGAAVSSWPDSSGNARNATQGTGANQPTKQTVTNNGKTFAVVRFVTDDVLTLPNVFTGFTSGEMFLVVKANADPPGVTNGIHQFGSTSQESLYPHTDGSVYDGFATTGRKSTGNPATTLAQWNVYNAVSRAAEWTSRINGTQHFTTATNTVGWTTAPTLGGSLASTFFAGDIAACLIYSPSLSASDRSRVLSYLGNLYGVTVSP